MAEQPIVFMAIIKVETIIKLAEKHGFYYKTTGIWYKTNPMPRNMHLHFVNSQKHGFISLIKKELEHSIMMGRSIMILSKHQ